jgi:hypothetical protein
MLVFVSTSARSKFDDSRWPVVVITLPPEPLDGPAFDEHCGNMFSCYERGQSFGWVIDARKGAQLTAAQRRTIAEKNDAHTAKHPHVKCFVAVVVSSAVQRGIVRAITWMTRQPVPTLVCASVEEGMAWVRKSLATGVDAERRAPSRA